MGIICQNLTIREEEGEEGKKRLVDLRRLSLMASPQVKRKLKGVGRAHAPDLLWRGFLGDSLDERNSRSSSLGLRTWL